jgi:hypothetical protein
VSRESSHFPFALEKVAIVGSLLAAGYISVRNNNKEPRSVSSDEWFLGKYSPFSCKIFPRNIFIAFYGNFRPCFQHISGDILGGGQCLVILQANENSRQ